jgi:hypothetical protein
VAIVDVSLGKRNLWEYTPAIPGRRAGLGEGGVMPGAEVSLDQVGLIKTMKWYDGFIIGLAGP